MADITEERRIRDALRDSEERTALALEGADLGIYEWDPVADRLVWSDTLRRQFGVDLDAEITLDGAMARIHPEDQARVRQSVLAAIDPQGSGRYDIEYRTVPLGGQVRWLHVLGRVRFEQRDGRRLPVRFAGVAIDISQRKQLEAALRDAARRKDEFLAMLAHELRNPLAPLRTAAEVMRSGTLDAERLQGVQEIIARQVAHMARLVDDLLDAARVDQGRISLSRAPLELEPLLSAAVESASSFTRAGRHEVELALPSEPLWVDADPVRLTQVLTNLLHNAAKFTPNGVTIQVSVRREDEQAVVCVRDNGSGIAPELMPHIFEMFTQGDSSLSREQGGLGIGLSLVRNLVALHGGSVSATSAGRGQGSTFTVRLPLCAAPATRPSAGRAPGTAASRRILVVDDNRDAADTLRLVLEASGYTVVTAYDGPSALEVTHRVGADVMLVDIGLPGMDGYELARQLRTAPGGRDAMIVALTGYGSPEDRQRAREAGFDMHLVKPVDFQDLTAAIEGTAVP